MNQGAVTAGPVESLCRTLIFVLKDYITAIYIYLFIYLFIAVYTIIYNNNNTDNKHNNNENNKEYRI